MMGENPRIISTAEPFLFKGDHIGCLLIHGFTGTPKEMRWMGEYLAGRGRTVLGIRLAGHATHPSDMLRSKWEDWFASVEDGIHILRSTCDRLFVIGLSMGGVLTLLAASRFHLDGIVVMSAPHDFSNDPRFRFLPICKYFIPEIPKGPSDWHDKMNLSDHISYPKYPTRCIAEMVELQAEMRASLSKITTPMLIMQSREDNTVPHNSMEYIVSHVSSRIKEPMWIENSGHVITREPPRLQVFQAADDFINRQLI